MLPPRGCRLDLKTLRLGRSLRTTHESAISAIVRCPPGTPRSSPEADRPAPRKENPRPAVHRGSSGNQIGRKCWPPSYHRVVARPRWLCYPSIRGSARTSLGPSTGGPLARGETDRSVLRTFGIGATPENVNPGESEIRCPSGWHSAFQPADDEYDPFKSGAYPECSLHWDAWHHGCSADPSISWCVRQFGGIQSGRSGEAVGSGGRDPS